MCVGSLCTTTTPTMIKIHPVFIFFFISFKYFLKSSRSQMPVCVTSHRQAPPTPALSELSSVRHCFHCQSRCSPEWLLSGLRVLLLDVIMNIAVVIYSRHLSRWDAEDYLFLKGKRGAGGGAEAHLHLKRHAIKQLAVDRAVFDRVQTVLFYTIIAEILTKLCYRLFIRP